VNLPAPTQPSAPRQCIRRTIEVSVSPCVGHEHRTEICVSIGDPIHPKQSDRVLFTCLMEGPLTNEVRDTIALGFINAAERGIEDLGFRIKNPLVAKVADIIRVGANRS
jgi:hypothetical protein